MAVNFEDVPTFRNISIAGQASSLVSAAFGAYSTNGGAPSRTLTDSSTLAQTIAVVKTIIHDIFQAK